MHVRGIKCCILNFASFKAFDLIILTSRIYIIRYFSENKLACVIENKEDLASKINELINNDELRQGYIQRAYNFSENNHNPVANSDKTKKMLTDIYNSF